MSDVLSQDEIEALLTAMDGDEDDIKITSSSKKASALPSENKSFKSPYIKEDIDFELYDFRRPDKLGKDHIRTLHLLHETFARLAGTTLSAHLRSSVAVELISVEQIPYDEYLRGISSSIMLVVNPSPLRGQGIFEIELDVLFPMLDKLLGGPGRSLERNVLTEIEKPLVEQMFQKIFDCFQTSWENIQKFNLEIDSIENSVQFVQIAPPGDMVVSMLFEVRTGNIRGAMSICIPYQVLKPIAQKLSAQKWFTNVDKRVNPDTQEILKDQILDSIVDCSIALGKRKISIGEFLDLKNGDVIRLNKKSSGSLPFYVEKVPKLIGKPALDGKKLVFHVTQKVTKEMVAHL